MSQKQRDTIWKLKSLGKKEKDISLEMRLPLYTVVSEIRHHQAIKRNAPWLCDKSRTRRQKAYEKKRINRYAAIKDEVMGHYGGYICACCGETGKRFLQLDHINNDGHVHRKAGINNTYSWIKKHNFPSIFQVLCANCNWSKRLTGVCPHVSSPQDHPIRQVYLPELPRVRESGIPSHHVPAGFREKTMSNSPSNYYRPEYQSRVQDAAQAA